MCLKSKTKVQIFFCEKHFVLHFFLALCFQHYILWQPCSDIPPLCVLKMILSKEPSFFFSMMWICMGVLLLWVGSRGHVESHLVQFSPADFYHKLEAGKIMLVFFHRQGVSLVFAEVYAVKLL